MLTGGGERDLPTGEGGEQLTTTQAAQEVETAERVAALLAEQFAPNENAFDSDAPLYGTLGNADTERTSIELEVMAAPPSATGPSTSSGTVEASTVTQNESHNVMPTAASRMAGQPVRASTSQRALDTYAGVADARKAYFEEKLKMLKEQHEMKMKVLLCEAELTETQLAKAKLELQRLQQHTHI
ncbi:uncharacterized protein LOC135398872 [Ornithodoros turicata]|uniref:uncharacterized protein LOC135373395 n=1 Tax=Ornithodoros turicata TaxID=34597 RepID=UPI003138A956